MLQSHIAVLEINAETQPGLLLGLDYLLSISYVEDVEVFKVSGRAM